MFLICFYFKKRKGRIEKQNSEIPSEFQVSNLVSNMKPFSYGLWSAMLVLSREQTVGDSGQTWNLSFLATSPGGSSLCLQWVLFVSACSWRIALISCICSPGETSILSVQFTADSGIRTGLLTVCFKGYVIFFLNECEQADENKNKAN